MVYLPNTVDCKVNGKIGTLRLLLAENGEYKLTFPDGRWITMEQKEDFSQTVASSDEDSRQNIPTHWIVLRTSGKPDWVNREQVQVLGELVIRHSPAVNN